MNTATHPVAREEIMALFDGELSTERAQSVSAHLDQCAECGAFVKELQTSSRNLAQWKVGSLPPSLDESLNTFTTNLTGNPRNSGSRVFYHPSRWTWKQWVLGLGSAATALLLLLFIATPNLLRSRMAANEAAAIGRARRKEAAGGVSVDSTRVDLSTEPGFDALKERGEEGRLSSQEKYGLNLPTFTSKLPPAPPPPPPSRARTGEPSESQPMIARSVSLAIVVKDFEAGRASLDAMLTRHNGYAAGLNVATPQGAARTLQASLRIPAPQLASAVAELKALGRVEGESQNGEEVTQQHADLVARLKNSRETEQRLQDVLRTRTGKVKDVLEVEEEIARVRGEIEQMEAEQQTLEHRVTFATVDLKLAEEYKAQISSPAPSVAMQLRNASVNGLRNAFESLLGILLFCAESVPTVILWLAILLIPAWMLWRRYRRAYAMGASL